MSTVRRVGHKGADLIAPGNTRASFDAALEHGVDMIEFDVLPELGSDGRPNPHGRLMLAHDYHDLVSRTALTLEEGLTHLADHAFAELEFDVDMKLPGYEHVVVEALRRHGLVTRTLISGMYRSTLERVRQLEPQLRLGWSVPRVRRDYTTDLLMKIPALAALTGYRAVLPRRARQMLLGRRCDAIMAHWRLVTPSLIRAVASADGELYVWTVDEQPMIERFTEMGVDGIITNDPRLFAI